MSEEPIQEVNEEAAEDAAEEAAGPSIPLRTAEMPERTKSFWKLAGPGAVLVGLSIGSGELIIWPTIAAKYGSSMLWAAGLGLFAQLWVNFEVARWSVATGESSFSGFARVWRGFGWMFIVLTVMAWIGPGWAQSSGLALKALIVEPDGFGSNTFWTAVTFLFAALLLFGPKLVYTGVERSIELLIIIVVAGLIAVAFAVGTADTWRELGGGLLNFGQVEEGMNVKDLFSAAVFAGAGGTANLFYGFYLRDKKIGMSARLPSLENPFRGRREAAPAAGFIYDDSNPENGRRFRDWFSYIRKDQTLFFFGLNALTMCLFIFGSLATLHPQGIVPESGMLVYREAEMLVPIWGELGRKLFLLVGVATLFSTQLALIDGCARSVSDILYFNVPAARKRSLSWWYMVVAIGWMIVGTLIVWIWEMMGASTLGVFFAAGFMGGIAMAIYVPLLLYMNLKKLPKSARPNAAHISFTGLAGLAYVVFAVWSLVEVIAPFAVKFWAFLVKYWSILMQFLNLAS